MHARAGELVSQALGDGLGFIGLGIRRGQPGCEEQGANDDQQGVNNRLQHEDLLFNKAIAAQRGHASGVSAITTAALTRQNRPSPVRAHCAAISSFVVGAVVGVECMRSPVGKEKARERMLRAGTKNRY